MPSWRSPPPTGMGSDCDGATASCASTSSPSSTIPRSPPTITGASANSAPPLPIARSPAASDPHGAPISTPPSAPSSAPPRGVASAPIRPSEPPYRASPSSLRVEQIQFPQLLTDESVRPKLYYWQPNAAEKLPLNAPALAAPKSPIELLPENKLSDVCGK